MKKLVFLLVFFIGFNCYSQENSKRHTFSFGTNVSFFPLGSISSISILDFGEAYGLSIYGEYSFSINENISLSPRILNGYAFMKDDIHYGTLLSSFTLSATIDYCPLPNSFRNLKINVGGLYHRLIKTEVSNYNSPTYPSRAQVYSLNKWGLLGSIKVDIIDKEMISLGVRYDVLSSFDANNLMMLDSWQIGPYIGIKIK